MLHDDRLTTKGGRVWSRLKVSRLVLSRNSRPAVARVRVVRPSVYIPREDLGVADNQIPSMGADIQAVCARNIVVARLRCCAWS